MFAHEDSHAARRSIDHTTLGWSFIRTKNKNEAGVVLGCAEVPTTVQHTYQIGRVGGKLKRKMGQEYQLVPFKLAGLHPTCPRVDEEASSKG